MFQMVQLFNLLSYQQQKVGLIVREIHNKMLTPI